MMKKIPKGLIGVKKLYDSCPLEVREYYAELPKLLNNGFGFDLVVAYLFFRMEQAQRWILYAGARKLHQTNSDLTWKAIDKEDITRKSFWDFFHRIYALPKKSSVNVLRETLEQAEEIRDRVMHGKDATDNDKREAIARVLHYSTQVNDLFSELGHSGIKPFASSYQGAFGQSKTLETKTSRWVLKGLGFTLS